MVYALLQPSIDFGLPEREFWEMTKAEVERFMKGAAWRYKTQAQFDYVLADIIGISVARILNKDVRLPSVEQVYPSLFEEEIKKQEQVSEDNKLINSQNNFLAFARAHNAKMRKEGNKE